MSISSSSPPLPTSSDAPPEADLRVRVVADFGGTNARFATVGASPRDLRDIEVYKCAKFPSLPAAVDFYLKEKGLKHLDEVCLAVAGPVDRDIIDLPNNHWSFSRSDLARHLGAPLTVINDFTAQALALDLLEADEIRWIGGPRPDQPGVRTIIGPGTGLGVAIVTPSGEIIPSEAGHMGFAAASEHEIRLHRMLFARYRRVSVERLASGPGLENLYWANRRIVHGEPESDQVRHTPAQIAEMAHQGDRLAEKSIEDFFDILAGFAGDMALATWATGGVYISGAVVRKLAKYFDPQRFRAAFQDKGRFTRFCEQIPLGWVLIEQPGLLGCAAALGRKGMYPGLS